MSKRYRRRKQLLSAACLLALTLGLATCAMPNSKTVASVPSLEPESVTRASKDSPAEPTEPMAQPPEAVSPKPTAATTGLGDDSSEVTTELTSAPVVEEPSTDAWDLVWISDSTGWGAADTYAEFIAEDLGVNVNVHDYASSGLGAGFVLKALESEESNRLADTVANAEILVLYVNPTDVIGAEPEEDWSCIWSDGKQYVSTCPEFSAYRDALKAIYQAVLDLRGDQPIIIRAYDSYNFPRRWAEDGVSTECGACWTAYSQAAQDAAAAFDVPFAHVFDDFTGPEHDLDPAEMGLIRNDGLHTNESGAIRIASLIRDLGYVTTVP